MIYFRILAAAGATNLLLVTFLIPVSALLLGTAVLGERLAPGELAGMALIGARPRRDRRPAVGAGSRGGGAPAAVQLRP